VRNWFLRRKKALGFQNNSLSTIMMWSDESIVKSNLFLTPYIWRISEKRSGIKFFYKVVQRLKDHSWMRYIFEILWYFAKCNFANYQLAQWPVGPMISSPNTSLPHGLRWPISSFIEEGFKLSAFELGQVAGATLFENGHPKGLCALPLMLWATPLATLVYVGFADWPGDGIRLRSKSDVSWW